tara:strand:+ start:1987 stop:2865 length:879 start_codon:yes stop_codon:yes gene_type:complete
MGDPITDGGPMSFIAKIKTIKPLRSDKPFLITTRDALIVAVITVLVILVLMFFVNLAMGTLKSMITVEFGLQMLRSFGTALAFQYAYEYAGFNSMLAESAMRYAKGSALSKYQSRNQAFVANMAAEAALKLASDPDYISKLDIIKANLARFTAMIKATRQAQPIAKLRMENPSISEKDIYDIINKRKEYVTKEDINTLLHLDPSSDDDSNLERLRATTRLVEIMGTHVKVVEYFMREGFSKLKPKSGRFGNATLDLPELLTDLGMEIDAQKELSIGKKLMLKAGKLVPLINK